MAVITLSLLHDKNLPKLGWVCVLNEGDILVKVYHGSMVEVAQDWIIEGVWDSQFQNGDFDHSNLVFGTGVRVRGDRMTFVSSSSMVDRLWVFCDGGNTYISNSLPCLMSKAGNDILAPDENYSHKTFNSIEKYNNESLCDIASNYGTLSFLFSHNIMWDTRSLRVIRKDGSSNNINKFDDYILYLRSSASLIGENASSDFRSYKILQLATLSSGYDSTASAVVAAQAGCFSAVTISKARSVIPRQDSGSEIAKHLGFDCEEYSIVEKKKFHDELFFWASCGLSYDLNFSIFKYPKPLSLLYTGVFGDLVWDNKRVTGKTKFKFPNVGVGMSEFRLKEGIFHCPVPSWGFDKLSSIRALNAEPDMKEWSIGGSYDRPLPRRICEEANIPRELFGQKKSATQFEDSFEWPYDKQLSDDYKRHLKTLSLIPPIVFFWRLLNFIDRNFYLPLEERIKILRKLGIRAKSRKSNYIFQWSNKKIARIYINRKN